MVVVVQRSAFLSYYYGVLFKIRDDSSNSYLDCVTFNHLKYKWSKYCNLMCQRLETAFYAKFTVTLKFIFNPGSVTKPSYSSPIAYSI